MRHRDDAKAAAKIRAAIHNVLCVDFVEWNEVNAYVNELDEVLGQILSLGKSRPAAALDLIWHFIKTIPDVFNSVHDECELEMFCSELARAAWSLRKKAGRSIQDSAARLLEAYAADAHDTCRFEAVLEILGQARLNRGERRAIAESAQRVAQAHPKAAPELRALADKLSEPAGSR